MKKETIEALRDYHNSYHREYRKKRKEKIKRYQLLRYHYLAELKRVEAGINGTLLLKVLEKKIKENDTKRS